MRGSTREGDRGGEGQDSESQLWRLRGRVCSDSYLEHHHSSTARLGGHSSEGEVNSEGQEDALESPSRLSLVLMFFSVKLQLP